MEILVLLQEMVAQVVAEQVMAVLQERQTLAVAVVAQVIVLQVKQVAQA